MSSGSSVNFKSKLTLEHHHINGRSCDTLANSHAEKWAIVNQ